MKTNLLLKMLGSISGAFLFAVPVYATNGLETLAPPVQRLFSQADVVFLGEYHSMSNHKDVLLAIMPPLVESGTIDTVAVEFVQYTDNDLLREYLRDPQATRGSEKESQYFLRLSNCNRRCGGYGRTGSWPIIGSPYESVLREMRRLTQSRPNIRFCGINSDQFYKQQFYEINSDVVGLKLLSPATKQLGEKIFGDSLLPTDNEYGWGSGSLRELRFASGVTSCLAGSKKALVFTGGFHAMQISKMASSNPIAATWASAADLVAKLSAKTVRSGSIATSSQRAMQDSSDGLYGSNFQSKHAQSSFQFRSTSELPPQTVQDASENGFSSLSTYDFVIVGPRSDEIENKYELQSKLAKNYSVAPGELANIVFTKQSVEFRPQLNSWRIQGRTAIDFNLKQNGRFAFQYWGKVKSIRLDGTALSKNDLVHSPSSTPLMSPLYVINRTLDSRANHRVEIEFQVPSGTYTIFEGNHGKLLTFETRTDNRYGIGTQWLYPTINLPTVSPETTISILDSDDFKVSESTVLCHCEVVAGTGSVKLAFGTTPSQQLYFQIRPKVLGDTDVAFKSRAGLDVRASLSHFFYGAEFLRSKRNANDARASLERDLLVPFKQVVRETIQRMETLIGPYPHGNALVVEVHPDYRGDSMEYSGAVHSGLGILVHELIHQWFATSVKPQSNADAWLMESITTWLELRQFGDLRTRFEPFMKSRDQHFQSDTSSASGSWDVETARQLLLDPKYCPSPDRLDLCEGFSLEWYALGPKIFDAVDTELAQKSGGNVKLVGILREFFVRYRGQNVTAAQFIGLLKEKQPNGNWDEIFKFLR